MRFKYNHGGETYELAVAETKLTSPTGVVRHSGANNYVPLVNPADKNASHLRVRHNGIIRAPIRYFDEPINMLNGRTLADVKAIFQSGLGKYYFKTGDYFDITFADTVTLSNEQTIDADSTWRAVCLGIDHNPEIEGYNRGHFCIGQNTDGVEIGFYGKRMNATNTNQGGWASTELRAWLNSTFFDALPADLKAVISPCTKYTDNVGGTDILPENVTATVDNIWILSLFEVMADTTPINPAESSFCRQYDYYRNGNSVIRQSTDPTLYSYSRWHTRSPSAKYSTRFMIIAEDSFLTNYPVNLRIFVPCFSIA